MSESFDTELYMLCSHLMDGSISPEQFETLRALLTENPAAREQYIEFVVLSANLRRYAGAYDLSEDVPAGQRPPAILGEAIEHDEQIRLSEGAHLAELHREEIRRAAADALERFKEQERIRQEELAYRIFRAQRRWRIFGGVSLAALIITVLLGWLARSPEAEVSEPNPVVITRPPMVATVTEAMDADWSLDQMSPTVGTELTAVPMTLSHGFMQLTFANGARVILESPADVVLAGSDKIVADRGRLVAHVPPSAYGFQVQTPTALIVDMGTEFGIDVTASLTSEVHVFQGEVAFRSRMSSGTSQIIPGGQARRANSRTGSVDEIDLRADSFRRSWEEAVYMPYTSGDVRYVRSAPPSVVEDAFEEDRVMNLFLERKHVTLPENVEAEFALPGQYTSNRNRSLQRHIVPAGTRVDSYCLHLDMAVAEGRTAKLQGVITFNRPIVAVLIRQNQLVATDALLGAMHTRYGQESHRGLVESGSDIHTDHITITPDRCTLQVDITVAALDQIRVLVVAAETDDVSEGNEQSITRKGGASTAN